MKGAGVTTGNVVVAKMHEGELDLDADLVRGLLAEQFPQWARLSVERVPSSGTDNAVFRLGTGLAVRLPRVAGSAGQAEKELEWLPRLAPDLPLALPVPLRLGRPGPGFPWTWAVYEWIEGASARLEDMTDPCDDALRLARFLRTLQGLDTTVKPAPGNRGRPLSVRDAEVRGAIAALRGDLDTAAATAAWEGALEAPVHPGPGVWIHGDLLPGNLLLGGGRLTAVIDWSCLGVADPACDLMPAWCLFAGESRAAFRAGMQVDEACWARGRGWALSVALIQIPYYRHTNPELVETALRTISEVLAEGE